MSNRRVAMNEHVDVVVEILTRLDGRSLGVAACVCRLWSSIARNEQLWESLCFPHASPSRVRPVVVALGGYRRLYMMCVRPINVVLGRRTKVRTMDDLQLSLSLFCVDYYERQLGLGVGDAKPSSSLMFLNLQPRPLNV